MMSNAPGAIPNQNPAFTRPPSSAGIVVPKMEDQNTTFNFGDDGNAGQPNPAGQGQGMDSEMQLVSSLAKLQKMEAMIHQLRTLLPERLLEPIVPIVNPRKALPVPRSPQVLGEQLSQTLPAGVAEVQAFQNMWRGPEMKAIWQQVDAKIKENGGQLLQPTGVWERDYDVLLEELLKDERSKQETQQQAEEESARSKVQSADGDWRTIVEGFLQKNIPGLRITCSKNNASFIVVLIKAGMAFQAQAVSWLGGDGNGVPDWRVSNRMLPGMPKTKLETGIADCLNARPRQWDLAYLLDMIASYSDIKQTPCKQCNKMTDTATQLPTIRQSKSSEGQQQPLTWEAYHPACLKQ